MKRRLVCLLTIAILLQLFATNIFATDRKLVYVTDRSIMLDGDRVFNKGFNVSDNNYFKLRDLAQNLSATSSQFEVSWNSDKHLIEITTGKAYTPIESSKETYYYFGVNYYGKLKDQKILVDTKEHTISAFEIDGSNYFKLRDLGEILNFEVDWDRETGNILLYSSLGENTYRIETSNKIKDNRLNWTFPRWASTVKSHIIENQDKTISVIEASEKITIDTYGDNYKLINSETIDFELPKFGGFYSGEKYNYIVFGQDNNEENNGKEVIRIVKYDKNFKRLASISVKGGESFTIEPFSAGSCGMAEYGDELIVHTSRKRYTTEDGLNHQSQLTLIVNTSLRKVTNDLGRFQTNHVSHSFDQYVLLDGNKHVLLDHGDAYPRSILLSKESGNSYEEVNLFKIPGRIGANATGVSLGGFESSKSNYIVAMNTVDHSLVKEYTSFEMVGLEEDQRDIILCVVPKNRLYNSAVKQISLKKYVGTDKIGSIPKLVKINDDKFMVMWQEFNNDKKEGDLNYILIDGEANFIGGVETIKNFSLSECQPIVKDGKIIWYTNKNIIRMFYTIPLHD